jgi:hypothetical protein
MGKNRRELDTLCDALEAEVTALVTAKGMKGVVISKRARASLLEQARKTNCTIKELIDKKVRPVVLELVQSREFEKNWQESQTSDKEISVLGIFSTGKKGDETLH